MSSIAQFILYADNADFLKALLKIPLKVEIQFYVDSENFMKNY